VVSVNEAVQIAEDNDLILVHYLPQPFILIHFVQKHTFQHKAIQRGTVGTNGVFLERLANYADLPF
jgi:hypothetical protein